MSDGEPRAVRLAATARAGALVAGLLLVTMVVLLVLMLHSINGMQAGLERTNDRLENTNDRIVNTNQLLRPFADIAPRYFRTSLPLLRQTTNEVEQTTERILPDVERAVVSLTDAALPLVRELRGLPLQRGLAAVLETSDELLELLRTRPVGPAVSQLHAVLTELQRAGLVRDVDDALADARRLDLLRDADRALEAVPDVPQELEVLRERFAASLEVQCLLLEHIRSIDRKTGGEVPPETDPDRVPRECRDNVDREDTPQGPPDP